jgi:hypothetical protein
MLSLIRSEDSIPIALIKEEKAPENIIYVRTDADEDAEPDLDTSSDNKLKIFKDWLHLDKKLKEIDLKEMISAYNSGLLTIANEKLKRKYADGLKFVSDSLKKYLNFGKEVNLFPIVDKDSFRVSISALSGSGKSTFASDFVNHVKLRKGAGVFLFSPVQADDSLKIKNLIHVDLLEFEKENKGREFALEDITPGSIAIFDDIDSFTGKDLQKKYQEFRDIVLQRGRHNSISVLTISHSPMQGHKSKATNMECEYFALFPSTNKRDTATLLKTYCGYSKADIDEVLAVKSRWVFVKKSIPAYWVSQHSVRLM